MSLHGKVAIVTGAAQGIGRAIAEVLAQAGADIVVADLDPSRSKDTVAAVERLGRKALNVKVNVADVADTKAMVDQVLKEWGKVDILVNNAGITRRTVAADEGGRLESRAASKFERDVQLHKGGLALDDQAAVWSHRQHCVDRRGNG